MEERTRAPGENRPLEFTVESQGDLPQIRAWLQPGEVCSVTCFGVHYAARLTEEGALLFTIPHCGEEVSFEELERRVKGNPLDCVGMSESHMWPILRSYNGNDPRVRRDPEDRNIFYVVGAGYPFRAKIDQPGSQPAIFVEIRPGHWQQVDLVRRFALARAKRAGSTVSGFGSIIAGTLEEIERHKAAAVESGLQAGEELVRLINGFVHGRFESERMEQSISWFPHPRKTYKLSTVFYPDRFLKRVDELCGYLLRPGGTVQGQMVHIHHGSAVNRWRLDRVYQVTLQSLARFFRELCIAPPFRDPQAQIHARLVVTLDITPPENFVTGSIQVFW